MKQINAADLVFWLEPGELVEGQRQTLTGWMGATVGNRWWRLSRSRRHRKDEEKSGHDRTKDTIQESYAALAESRRTGQPIPTRLNPPPTDPRVAHPKRTSSSG